MKICMSEGEAQHKNGMPTNYKAIKLYRHFISGAGMRQQKKAENEFLGKAPGSFELRRRIIS